MSEITEVGEIAFTHSLPRQGNAHAHADNSGSNRYAGLRIIPARYPARIAGSVPAVLLLAAMVVVVNCIVDLLYAAIDPRIEASDI